MTAIYQDYINDLKDSLTSPLLIEVQKKHIEELKSNDSAFSDEDSYHNIYNKLLTDENTTNVVIVNAEKDKNTQILNAFYKKTNVALKNKLGINSLVKAGVYFATMGLGELVSKDITNKASELLGDNLDKVTKVFDNDWINEQISKKVTEKPANIVTDTAEDVGNTQAERLNAKHQFGSELFISANAKASLLALAKNMCEYHTPHQAMQFTLKLLTALGIDAPKLIVINNPFNLDSASLSLLSLLFSHAKDLKEKGQSTNISVLFNYTGLQPYKEPEQTGELESEAYSTFIKLKRLRHMVQRYGMLEKPGSSIPTPAIKSTTFVGRANEINDLTKAHASFVEFHQENKDRKKTSQWTLIKGEPGTGKTALINKHLANIDEKNDALSQSQIRLRQLNQVGHSSEVTGLASLLQSIQAEAERLTQYYQANKNFIQEKIADTSLTYKNSKADVKNLKDNRRGLFKLIKSATEFVVDVANLGTPYQAAASAIDTLTLDNKKLQTGTALQQEGSSDKKQEQFNQLNMALRYLSNIAQVVDEKAEQMPILLFVDDLQWIDELTAEFILAHLLPAFPSELLFTVRGSDSETSYKLAVKGQKHSPYKLALFDAVKLSTIEVNSEREPNTLVDNKLITLQPQIVIKGMDHETLSKLIELTYQNSSKEQTDTIASAVIKALSTEDVTETTQVVTLFAIETLNLISDPVFYHKNKLLIPLIIQPKKGVYEINGLAKQELINTVENIFTLLRGAHTQAYTHDSLQDNSNNHFTLSSYAVMEERLFIIGQYFHEYSDAAIFSLQLSALIGAPFDSELVRELINGLVEIDEEKHPELKPIKELLKNNSAQAFSPEHLEVLEEVFAILKRLQSGGSKHQYHHGLFALFLRQQVKHRLNELFNYQKNTHAVNKFFSYCQNVMKNKFEKHTAIAQSAHEGFEETLYYLNSFVQLFTLAVDIDDERWVEDYMESINILGSGYESVGRAGAITLNEASLAITERLFHEDEDRWAQIYTTNLNNLASAYQCVDRVDEAIALGEAACDIKKVRYVEQPSQWAESYTISLNNLATCYHIVDRVGEAIVQVEESRDILKLRYAEQPRRWEKQYNQTLHNLSAFYRSDDRVNEAIALAEESHDILKVPYTEQPGRWVGKYTNSLNNLAQGYQKVDRVDEAIVLGEESRDILKVLYSEQPSRWAENYSRSLNNLAVSYQKSDRVNEAIALREESHDILKVLYDEQPSRWAESYITTLNNLAVSYQKVGRLDEAIVQGEESREILKVLYGEQPSRWAESYTTKLNNLATSYQYVCRESEAIALREESRNILKICYDERPSRWSESYCISLNNLAVSYQKSDRVNEAIALMEESHDILKVPYTEQPSRWAEGYTSTLNNLALCYQKVDRVSEAIVLGEESCEILKILYIKQPSRWAESYTTKLNNLATYYQNVGRVNEEVELLEESRDIRKVLYIKQPSYWVESYTISLYNLASCYKRFGRLVEAITLGEESCDILKDLFAEQPNRWAENYIRNINNLATYYQNIGRLEKVISLLEELDDLLKVLCSNNPSRWEKQYNQTLHNLAAFYRSVGLVEEVIALFKESRDILKELFAEQPSRWAESYTNSLNSLELSYQKAGREDEALLLKEELVDILKVCYEDQPTRWTEKYTSCLISLAASYSSIGRVDKVIVRLGEARDVKKARYAAQPSQWAEDYSSLLNPLALAYKKLGRVTESITVEEELRDIQKELYAEQPNRWVEDYTRSLGNLAISYKSVDRTEEAITLQEVSLEIREKLYQENNDRWAEHYTVSLHNLADSYDDNTQNKKALACYRELKLLIRVNNNEEYSNISICELRMLNRLKEYVAFEELALNHQSELKQYPNEAWIPHNQAWLLGVWGNFYQERGLINQAKEKISQMNLLITEHQLEDFEAFDELIQQYVN